MSEEFTVTRRACLIGALIAPFMRPLAALGLEPQLRGSDFIIKSGGYTWNIRTTAEGKVDCVTFNGKPMRSITNGTKLLNGKDGYHTFDYSHDYVQSDIRFLVIDANEIQIDYWYAAEPLPPLVGVKKASNCGQIDV